jgi:glycosyltransferase involved in cell wall biosynthesis
VEPILPSLTIFFPCYNDESTIDKLVHDAVSVGYSLTDDPEVIVVDDGSIDGSRRVLETLRSRHRELRLVCHELNRGYGAALRSGFSAATKEWVFYTDGGGQYDVGDLPDLAEKIADVDVVNGHKISRSDRWYRIWIGKVYASVVRSIFDLPIQDIDCDFRLIRSSLLDQLDLHSDSGSICVELISGLAQVGARFREVPVAHYSRRFGRSEFFQPGRIMRTVYQLIQLRNRMIRGENT